MNKEETEGLMPVKMLQKQQIERELTVCAEKFARYGLELSPQQLSMLAQERERSLTAHGRMEFSGGILPKLADAFCTSPYLNQQEAGDMLVELQDSFYYFKNEAEDLISDDELIEFMRTHYDGICQGSLDYLRDMTLEELCRGTRYGEGWDEE